jgi:hypothetical protein
LDYYEAGCGRAPQVSMERCTLGILLSNLN